MSVDLPRRLEGIGSVEQDHQTPSMCYGCTWGLFLPASSEPLQWTERPLAGGAHSSGPGVHLPVSLVCSRTSSWCESQHSKWESSWDVPRRMLWELKYECRHICSRAPFCKRHLLEAGFFFLSERDESMGEVDAMFMKARNVFIRLICVCCWASFFSSWIFMCPLKLIGLLIIKISGDSIK